jgi:hypothetical protein
MKRDIRTSSIPTCGCPAGMYTDRSGYILRVYLISIIFISLPLLSGAYISCV